MGSEKCHLLYLTDSPAHTQEVSQGTNKKKEGEETTTEGTGDMESEQFRKKGKYKTWQYKKK